MMNNFDSQQFSKTLANAAFTLSKQGNYPSPFYLEAKRNGKKFADRKGKMDDITVVAEVVVDKSAPNQQALANLEKYLKGQLEVLHQETRLDVEELKRQICHPVRPKPKSLLSKFFEKFSFKI